MDIYVLEKTRRCEANAHEKPKIWVRPADGHLRPPEETMLQYKCPEKTDILRVGAALSPPEDENLGANQKPKFRFFLRHRTGTDFGTDDYTRGFWVSNLLSFPVYSVRSLLRATPLRGTHLSFQLAVWGGRF